MQGPLGLTGKKNWVFFSSRTPRVGCELCVNRKYISVLNLPHLCSPPNSFVLETDKVQHVLKKGSQNMVFWELVVKVSKSDYSSRKRSIRVSKDFKVCLENKFYPFCVPRLENFDCCFVVQFDLECKKYCNLKSNHFLCSSLKIYVKMWCWNIVMEDLPASVWLLDWTFWDRFPSTRYPPENILAHWWCWCWCWCCPNKGYSPDMQQVGDADDVTLLSGIATACSCIRLRT